MCPTNHEPSQTDANPSTTEPPRFPIVGIGASAGGLDSFRRLLGALPPETGMAYVFVQHLNPNHESILTELLAQVTKMVVTEVSSDVVVAPNRVYVIPSSSDLALAQGTLKLIARASAGTTPHMPIDSFLLTLAKAQGSQAIGVVLSGMGSDGTLGLAAIEAEGGIVFVQEPKTAKQSEMPLSAIAAGCVDFVLSPEDIARELVRLGEHPYLAKHTAERVMADPVVGLEPELGSNPELDSAADHGDVAALAKIVEALKQVSGTSFSAYKKTTLRRRIERRMAVVRVDGLWEYAAYLADNSKECQALYDDCLISVTSFFRDPEVFSALEQHCALVLRDRNADAPFRAWVPGCATGEEAYSIAMSLLEGNGEGSQSPALQIFATDISARALTKAREGVYLVNSARYVPTGRLRRFFTKNGDHYRVNKSLREMCVFAHHDLTRDPPYSHLDLISCRNLLIYLEPALQEMVLATFHYALRPGGLLLLGPAESAVGAGTLFTALDERHKIYSKMPAIVPPRLLSANSETSPSWTVFDQPTRKVTRSSEVLKEVDRIVLSRFGPAAIVVDENCNVLEFRGDTDPFLDHGHGRASLNLERLLRRGLLLELREAIAEVRATGVASVRTGLRVRNREQLQTVSVEVIPVVGRVAQEGCLLILFVAEPAPVAISDMTTIPTESGETKDREIQRLNQGLGRVTDHMHTLLREHETAVAELQATTEEALSNNEELQSLNEELQTAKEEIQSTNEELATLNQELHDRNAQLARLNDDIQRGLDSANALVDTVPIPLLILDFDLRVHTANVAYYEDFDATLPNTRGKLLSELDGQWASPQLLSGLQRLVNAGTPVQDFVVEATLPLGERTLSINARRIETESGGKARVLIAIEDRTAIVRAERGREALLVLEQKARHDAEAADRLKDHFVATVSHELRGPLSVIAGWVEVISVDLKERDLPTLTRGLAAIRRGVAAQKRLISELLDHSRFVMGKVVLERSTIDLMTIAQTCIVGIRAAADAKEIEISFLHGNTACCIYGDRERMQQVMWNLLLNAIKFTPPKGRLTLSIGRALNQVHFTVTDTGIGISPEFLPHVFERFRQAEGHTTRSQPGLGLGLKLVHELVELHGGTVHAHSPGLGLGATFVVVLPVPALLLEPSSQDEDNPLAPVSNRAPSVPPEAMLALTRDFLAGIRLLVIDDEPDACGALAGLLHLYGASARSASSAEEALEMLADELPDLLISDIGLPEVDGFELMRRVRLLPEADGGKLPAIAVSAYAKDSYRPRALKAGFQIYLEKPVPPHELMKAVAKLTSKLIPPA